MKRKYLKFFFNALFFLASMTLAFAVGLGRPWEDKSRTHIDLYRGMVTMPQTTYDGIRDMLEVQDAAIKDLRNNMLRKAHEIASQELRCL